MRPARIVIAIVALFVAGCGTTQPSKSGSPGPVAVGTSSPAPAGTEPPTPVPRPTPSPSAPPEPTPILDGAIAPIDGWTTLGGLTGDGTEASGGVGTLSGTMPAGWAAVMASVACAGRGSLHIESGDDTRDIDCPVTTSAPERFAFFADTPSYRVKVTRSGLVAYEVRVDGARSVLVRPPVLVTGDGKPARMTEGCGISMELAWGFNAAEGCATNIPGDPIPTVTARNGRLDIRIPGWTIAGAAVHCGRIGPNDIPEFIELRGCKPKIRIDGSAATISGLPSAGGRRLLEFGFTARNAEGDEFQAPYYAWVRP